MFKNLVIIALVVGIGYVTFPMWKSYVPECNQITIPLKGKGVICLWK